jgi:hypothetical protein
MTVSLRRRLLVTHGPVPPDLPPHAIQCWRLPPPPNKQKRAECAALHCIVHFVGGVTGVVPPVTVSEERARAHRERRRVFGVTTHRCLPLGGSVVHASSAKARTRIHFQERWRAQVAVFGGDAVALWSPVSLNPGLSATTSASLTSSSRQVQPPSRCHHHTQWQAQQARSSCSLRWWCVSSPPVAGGRRAEIRLD